MATRIARDRNVDLNFYRLDGSLVILASWDEDEERTHPAMEAEVLAKYFSLLAKPIES